MILLDEDDSGPSKLAAAPVPTLRLPEPVAGRSSPLPDYETSQLEAQHTVIFRKPTFPNRFDSRFWRVTFFALAIYVFLSIIIGIPLIVTRIAARKAASPTLSIQSLFIDDGDETPPPLNLAASGIMMTEAAIACDKWDSTIKSGPLFVATAKHTLTPNGLIAIRSNATEDIVPHTGGRHNLTVDINSDPSAKQAVLTVTLTTSSVQLRQAVHMCFSSSGGSRGVSIYFPRYMAQTDVLSFDIRLLFPQSSQIRTVSNFITYLPMFHQSFGNLGPSIHFSNVNIAGAGMDVICDSLQANRITARTSFASLSGTFNVTQSLKLDNIEGPIFTSVTLYNNPSQLLPTYLGLDTGNGDLIADVTMTAPKSVHPPQYLALVGTFNGSLVLNVSHDVGMDPAALNMRVTNNQAPTKISLDSKFTGLFSLRTKLAPITLDYKQMQGLKDPTGCGRQWSFDTDSNLTTSVQGWLGWGTRPKVWDPSTESQVMVSSSLSPVELQLVA
ncbi:hypothetical protein B0H15DRAFT_859176 [Mycena belliarum]|uniref:Uncharacterized protein n=1 Tax=Mycena belliarum TaxID=1033014 RepID=A0AAD6TYX9_9AGAR|nr:hypothetical protein B0H15DRAFT_859176 [Mycena belliae]